jgi:RNA polymerase sigma-70 factor, ECF subfamily
MAEHDGNAKNLEELYRQYRQGLFTLALSITACPGKAEDAVHEAFARICRNHAGQDIGPAYLFAAVRNAARDQRRRTRPSQELPISIFDNRPGPAASAETSEAAALARQYLQELDEPSREVVVMKLYANLTFDQIAQVTSEPLQTLASRYRRALLRLKERLESCV